MPKPKARGDKTDGTSVTSGTDENLEAGPAPAPTPAPGRHMPGLHIVATPIGNAADLGRRALSVLSAADLIACEDTRVTRKLMGLYGIRTPLLAYNDHNGERVRPYLLERLREGAMVALVSDAGTPLVSDPGYKLVREVIDADLKVTVVPGPSAPIAALALSGLPSDRFLFAGFLPPKTVARRRDLQSLREVQASLIFFESGPRLVASLADMLAMLGDRKAAVARELTKIYEEVRRGTLGSLSEHYRVEGPPRGEIVVVIGPQEEAAVTQAAEADLDSKLRAALERGTLKEASAAVAAELGLPRRQVYARALALTGEEGR